MKWFYIVSVGGVALLALSPLGLLPEQRVAQVARAEGKVVTYGSYGAKIRTLDPATCGDTLSASVQGNVYEGLYGYHYLSRPPLVVPLLAEGLPEISADNLTYTIKLKQGVKYCRNACFGLDPGGQPRTRTVTAEDFVLAFKRIADFHLTTPLSLAFIEDKILGLGDYRDRTRTYDKGDFRRYDEPFEGVKALDEHTFQIRLSVPFPQLLYVLAINNFAPIPRELVDYYLSTRDDGHGGREPLPFKDRSPQIIDYHAAVGTGAYYFTEFVPGGDIILERNPDFRLETYPCQGEPSDKADGLLDDCGRPVPFVDMNCLLYVPEANPSWNLFLGKVTDVSGIPQQLYNMVVSPSAELTAKWGDMGVKLLTTKDPVVTWYAFNMDDPVVGKSKSLRQAICLAFNVEQYVEVLFNGRGKRAVNTVPSLFGEHKDLPVSPYAHFDLAAAKAKMFEARKELEAAGVIKPGEPLPTLRIDLGGREEEERRIGEYVQFTFKRIGLKKPEVELNDWPTLQEKVENKQCQIYAMGWHADYPDPENFLQLYYTPNIKRGTNNCNYSNSAFDRLYEQAAKMLPSEERTELYARMVAKLNEDCPVVLMVEPVGMTLYHSWVHNLKPHPIGYGFYKYRRIDTEARARAGGR